MNPRFIKLDAQGNELPTTATDHVAVRDTLLNLTWSGTLEGGRKDHADATKACAALDQLGTTGWRLPTIQELLSLVDYEKSGPAIDTDAFPETESSWYWTSTSVAGYPDVAWYVHFGHGYSSWFSRSLNCFVRAVRPSQ